MFKLLLILFYSIQLLWATNAYPGIITIQQPDGSLVECYVKGDENANWHEDLDGYSITKNESGIWVYAESVDGNFLVPGDRIFGQDLPPLNIKKHLKPAPVYSYEYGSNINLNALRSDIFQLPVIYFGFFDMPLTFPMSDIDSVFNQEGYECDLSPGSGSFRDFWEEMSYGQFSTNAHIMGEYSTMLPHSFYGSNLQRIRELMRSMIDQAEADGVNWSQFDNDGDGEVDNVAFVHAGQGGEQGDPANIWSRRMTLNNESVTYDGVFINDCIIVPEIQFNGSILDIVAIGVIAHEFGHALGLPDLYDTDYSSRGVGSLALMSYGMWGNDEGICYPSSMSAWSRAEMGWSNVVEISTGQTNIALEQSYTNNTIYRVNNIYDESEYWLIENRQQNGTDVGMPEPGLLFWHIDTEKTNLDGDPNDDEPHYGVGLEQADGLFELENNGYSDRGDPYPGLTENREFSHCSSPQSVSYYYQPSGIAFSNISDADSIMYFDLHFDTTQAGHMHANGSGDANDIGELSISMTNSIEILELSFALDFAPSVLTIQSVDLAGRATADSIVINGNYIELINPSIPSGSGEIIILDIYANTDSEENITVISNDIFASDSLGSLVCIVLHESSYSINLDVSTNYELFLPESFFLQQNFPNPFNPFTTLQYNLPENSMVNVTVYDMLGRHVKTLVNQDQVAGYKSVVWDATNDYGKPVSAGIYLYQIHVDNYIQTKKMVLLK